MADVSPSSASDLEKASQKEAHHEHHEVHSGQIDGHAVPNKNLRIDGDDEDHMHEPPVCLLRWDKEPC